MGSVPAGLPPVGGLVAAEITATGPWLAVARIVGDTWGMRILATKICWPTWLMWLPAAET
ncbi:hypothetical protein B4N89_21415 [Embleya scabrispora]|uniref:Uncharacterized protein n=1 Tax=Embleya scabrispora TaxID=159449 RepID=A0A1T3P2G8_9ACTN|nr:hypothetical protein B4N89_21415 [Embleya scabrispora]